jgi:hypothetical protein
VRCPRPRQLEGRFEISRGKAFGAKRRSASYEAYCRSPHPANIVCHLLPNGFPMVEQLFLLTRDIISSICLIIVIFFIIDYIAFLVSRR